MIKIKDDNNVIFQINQSQYNITRESDFPADILDAIIFTLLNHSPGSFRFFCERAYILVINWPVAYVIDQDTQELISVGIEYMDFINRTWEDISNNLEFWVDWLPVKGAAVSERRVLLQNKLDMVKSLLSVSEK